MILIWFEKLFLNHEKYKYTETDAQYLNRTVLKWIMNYSGLIKRKKYISY